MIEPSLQVLMLWMSPSACKCIYVEEEKRVQEGKNKAPVTIRAMPQTPVPSKLEHNFSLVVPAFVLFVEAEKS